jgi:hypothetical protein
VLVQYKNKSLMAFSKSGFTEDAIEYAKNNDIRLVWFEMM